MYLNRYHVLALIFVMGMASILPFITPVNVPGDFTISFSREYDHHNDVGSTLDPRHAERLHHEEASIARTCLTNPNKQMFFNPQTKRTGTVCLLPDGKWGIVIIDELGREVTAFVKNKMKRLEQVIKYMENCGYCTTQ